ncbi:MAG TPA: hypothetical protein V6C86_16005 [Oculatellaceae cyanobacterium]
MQTVAANSNNVLVTDTHTAEDSAILYMQVWMTVGTLCGGALGYYNFVSANGSFIPFVTLLAALTGATVGAALGQLIGGMFHVIANRSLD